MDFKEGFYKFWTKTKSFIDKGIIQRVSRISYDVIWNIILYFVVITVIGGFFVGGVGAGYFASLIRDEPLRSEDSMVSAIYNYSETSEIYFANDVFMGEVSSDLHREEVELADVSEYLIQGIIATEDEYFKTHNGIVPKAIMRAMFQELTGAAMQTGGSTLTQQIIKNQILTNEVSFDRKANEIILAMRLEQFLEKDEILEAYLNIVPFGRNANGRNIAGVQTAARGIFDINANELNLAQAAFLSGLPQSPIAYSPFTNSGRVKEEAGLQPGLSRMRTVLSRMLTAEYITEEKYEEALNYDIVADFAERSPTTYEEYPYLTEEVRIRTTEILLEQLVTEDGYTMDDLDSNEDLQEQYEIRAERALRQGGYKIHTTIDKDIYDAFQEVAANYENYGRDLPARNVNGEPIMTEDEETGELIPLVAPEQVGSMLIDNRTGAIISFVGGRDFQRQQRNFATNANRQLGSTAKPILVYGPAMEEGVVQPGSILADVEFEHFDEYGEPWSPSNFTRNRYYGLVSVRTALVNSYNVSAGQVYIDLLKESSPVEDYLIPMGYKNILPHQYGYRSNALGSFEATIEENTNGYATFGNNGNFEKSYMIEKIESFDGEVIYQHESESVEVFSNETSYLMLDMMRDVLTSGTGRTAYNNLVNKDVDWAGKTGTTNEFRDYWFVATNPNVSLGIWMGYEYNNSLGDGYSARTQSLWAQLVNAATEVNPDLMAPSDRFERPNNIVSRSYCMASGLLPSGICESLGLVGQDIYNTAHVPSDEDYSLIEGRYVMLNGEAVVAGNNTPEEFIQSDGVIFNPEWLRDMGYDELDDISQLIPSSSGAWSSIEIPSTTEIEDDGEAPNAPTSISKSGNVLTWNASSSNDVVGYRIYRANDPDSSFELLSSTTDTNFNVGSGDAVYHVTAVDYFGEESAPSDVLEDGDFTEEEPEESEEPEDDDGDSTDENSGNGGDSNGNGGQENNDNEDEESEDPDNEEEDE
ncbi:penicillin-binding protein [Natronobacillus azotifigens]|uniref:Transglycosylase domain-containing protein n=1 Tax=Natronobacillus azotifigens TaxID=472978 RepID=A0A9J6RCG1_9BACI|nr:transglycosylase domain-containing protein [Natronobacillus azotifigens]MCZ0703231.1 transglycosylase domain-containing protein [Natronobacillus azotifigens]